ncbi:hypothetical protein BBJ28_00007240 [Nothophytophthora sp. Chile5]|nr:hypothetical protein BBJ28_00007240 [Nothophytophthora sp. Chile5]
MASTSTDGAVGTAGTKLKNGKPRRKGSRELFDVAWETDTKVAKCGLCRSDFSLMRRKHHCRHCGRVMCSDCSCFLFFEFTHRKHRVCNTCNNQLLADQQDFEREGGGRRSEQQLSGETSRLFEDSGDENDGGRTSAVAKTPSSTASGGAPGNALRLTLMNGFTPRHSEDDVLAKAKKKLEKKERKEQRKKEKREKKRKEVQGAAEVPATQDKVERQGEKLSSSGTALFNAADDTWFSDVPERRLDSRESGETYSLEDGVGVKGPGWRDRVKESYTVTAAAEKQSTTGGTLTSGITGNGYFSEQFRYDDVSGPGLGHDDDFSEDMPRPKQQLALVSHEDLGGRPSPRRSEHAAAAVEKEESSEPDFQPRLTLKENLKDIFHVSKRRESTTKGQESSTKGKRKAKDSKPRARGDQNMTLDELEPSDVSEDEPHMPTPSMPRPTPTFVMPTFYDDDADKLVVDDSPGLFEASIAQRLAQRKKEELQQQQMARDMAWVNSAALPPTVEPRRISSGQESFSIVDHPSHTSNSPVQSRAEPPQRSGNAKGGFAGALKRFFGMGSKTPEKITAPADLTERKSTPSATPLEKTHNANQTTPIPQSNRGGSTIEPPLDDVYSTRHTVADYYGAPGESEKSEETFRYTMAGYLDPKSVSSHFEPSESILTGNAVQYDDRERNPRRKNSERSMKRRGTFDDLFESPKSGPPASGGGRYSTPGGGDWAATRPGDSSSFDVPSYAAAGAGTTRFDDRRSDDESDEFSRGRDSRLIQPRSAAFEGSGDDWRRQSASAMYSRRSEREDAAPSQGSAFTWSNVRSAPGVGTATYAVPTSLRPQTAYDGSSSQYYSEAGDRADENPPARPLGNIMDDLKRGSSSKASRANDSVEDFFAEFEEPNDYVFDPATGGYVAARAPPRAAPTRTSSRSESREFRESTDAPAKKTATRRSERDFDPLSHPVVTSTAITVVPPSSDEGEGSEEVADIIVDKISSLEDELAALKQLIRNRKGTPGQSRETQSHKPRASRYGGSKPSVRKESIFDNDSSEEEREKPSRKSASSRRPPSKREGKRRPGSKKKRRDSFAGLFDDSPDEKETLAGATSYEALFQNGVNAEGGSEGEDRDDESNFAAKLSKKSSATSKHRANREGSGRLTRESDSESEPEYASLKERRGKQSIVRQREEKVDVDSDSMETATKSVIPPSPIAAKSTKRKPSKDEDDPIDALFDTSGDRDVVNLFSGNDGLSDGEDQLSSPAEKQSPTSRATSIFMSQAPPTSPDDEEKSESSPTPVNLEAAVSTNDGYSLTSETTDEAVEEEEFSINWAKMRSTKLRRHGTRQSQSAPSEDVEEKAEPGDTSDDLLLEPSLLGTSTDRSVAEDGVLRDVADEAEDPSALLAAASSNWMAISMAGDEASQAVGAITEAESPLLSLDSGERDEAVVADAVETTEDRRDDANDASIPAVKQLDEAADSSESLDVPVISRVESTVGRSSTIVKRTGTVGEDDAALDIFDQSSDVDFLSLSSQQEPTISAHEESDNDEGDAEDLGGSFGFELQSQSKRASSAFAAPLEVSSVASVSERSESSPPSPASSTEDENVVFGKYAASSATSSRTPSVDGSQDDLEDAPPVEDPLLGTVETQAFDADWQQMQAKEKERKKRLQLKQRQAQRDKVLRKQGASSKALGGSSATGSSSKSKSKSGKKKKKADKDDTTPSSHAKKSGSSSRKHRHREKDTDRQADSSTATPSEPPRSLTEL